MRASAAVMWAVRRTICLMARSVRWPKPSGRAFRQLGGRRALDDLLAQRIVALEEVADREPTRPATYRTLRPLSPTDRMPTYKSAVQPVGTYTNPNDCAPSWRPYIGVMKIV